MKIISEFTDFYEYDCYRYGQPDQSITWIRHIIQDKYSRKDKLIKYIADKYLLSPWSLSQIVNGRLYKGFPVLTIFEHLVGVYPYVYWIPQVVYIEGRQSKTYFSIEDSIKCLKEPDYWKKLLKSKDISINRIAISRQINCAGKDIVLFNGEGRKISDNFVYKDEELFEKIGSPTFYIKIDDDYRNGSWDFVQINVNPCLCSETPLLEFCPDILNERDIYNDIENFLWIQNQEPVSVPDNKTKITSHGFDLKTSFRKM